MHSPTQTAIPVLPDDVVVSVQCVSKKFRRNLRRSLWVAFHEASSRPPGRVAALGVRSREHGKRA